MPAHNGFKHQIGNTCDKCGDTLTVLNSMKQGDHVRSICKKCISKYQKEYRIKNPDKQLGYDLKDLYGMTIDEYKRRVNLQFGGCAICKQPCASEQRLSVDHNHTTGQVRDLLCKRCNVIIGLCEENEELLFNIMDYLKRHDVGKVA